MSTQMILPLIPECLKPPLRPLYRYYRIFALRLHRRSRTEIHNYWQHPWDGTNQPEDYASVDLEPRSIFLLNLINQYATPESTILEIGCNVGRNLHYLSLKGFVNIAGIEISTDATKLGNEIYPELMGKLNNGSAELMLPKISTNTYDVVFTMAVLEHIHPDSNFIFAEMARITKGIIITIENEVSWSWKHYPRNYKHIFERLGMVQIYEQNCADIPKLHKGYQVRVFRK